MRAFSVLFFVLLGAVNLRATENTPRVVTEKFENGVIAQESYFVDNKLVEIRSYAFDGRFSGWSRYQYLSLDHVLKSELGISKERFGQVTQQEEWSALDQKNNEIYGTSVRHKKWFYSEEAPFNLEYVASFEPVKPFRILRKDYYFADRKTLKSSIQFSYQDGTEKPTAFVERLPRGKVISHFSKFEKYDQVKTLTELGKSAAEIKDLKKQRENPNKFLIAIIDSGFNFNHENLVNKWWNNPKDPIDGLDNDGNGWIDDNFGWDQVSNTGLPTESTISMANDERPLSHGTHVADIAIRDLNGAALVGFSGDYTQASYIKKISSFIKKHPVRLVNLSIGLPKDIKDSLGLRDGIKAQREMIEENPQILFVVAAGNESKNLDDSRNFQYPASFNFPNVLKVGALEASSFDGLIASSAKMAEYSNTGKQSVDILAPGKQIVAASLGGGTIAHTGTSMATPYALNRVARLWMEFPNMTAAQIRNLVIETAKPMKTAPEILSKGYLDLPAAQVKARLSFLSSIKKVEEGPNCWNEASFVAGFVKKITYTDAGEFAEILDSEACHQIPMSEGQTGDIVALRRFDRSGKLLPAPLQSEVHGYTFLDTVNGFTKNGTMAAAKYETMSHEDILQFYKKTEYQNCKMFGIERVDCNMKPVLYHCQSK